MLIVLPKKLSLSKILMVRVQIILRYSLGKLHTIKIEVFSIFQTRRKVTIQLIFGSFHFFFFFFFVSCKHGSIIIFFQTMTSSIQAYPRHWQETQTKSPVQQNHNNLFIFSQLVFFNSSFPTFFFSFFFLVVAKSSSCKPCASHLFLN